MAWSIEIKQFRLVSHNHCHSLGTVSVRTKWEAGGSCAPLWDRGPRLRCWGWRPWWRRTSRRTTGRWPVATRCRRPAWRRTTRSRRSCSCRPWSRRCRPPTRTPPLCLAFPVDAVRPVSTFPFKNSKTVSLLLTIQLLGSWFKYIIYCII